MASSSTNCAASIAVDREGDGPHPRQIALYRAASPAQKLAIVGRLNATLIELKEADLASRFPEATPQARRQALRRWWLAARD